MIPVPHFPSAKPPRARAHETATRHRPRRFPFAALTRGPETACPPPLHSTLGWWLPAAAAKDVVGTSTGHQFGLKEKSGLGRNSSRTNVKLTQWDLRRAEGGVTRRREGRSPQNSVASGVSRRANETTMCRHPCRAGDDRRRAPPAPDPSERRRALRARGGLPHVIPEPELGADVKQTGNHTGAALATTTTHARAQELFGATHAAAQLERRACRS